MVLAALSNGVGLIGLRPNYRSGRVLEFHQSSPNDEANVCSARLEANIADVNFRQ